MSTNKAEVATGAPLPRAIGCSGGTDSQDEVVSKAGAGVINKLPAGVK
jgi:hypothetical protein